MNSELSQPKQFAVTPVKCALSRHSIEVNLHFARSHYPAFRGQVYSAGPADAIRIQNGSRAVISNTHEHSLSEIYIPLGESIEYDIFVQGLTPNQRIHQTQPHIYIPAKHKHSAAINRKDAERAKKSHLVGILLDDGVPSTAKPELFTNRPRIKIERGVSKLEHYNQKDASNLPFKHISSVEVAKLRKSVFHDHDEDQLHILITSSDLTFGYFIEYRTTNGGLSRLRVDSQHQAIVPKGVKHRVKPDDTVGLGWAILINGIS